MFEVCCWTGSLSRADSRLSLGSTRSQQGAPSSLQRLRGHSAKRCGSARPSEQPRPPRRPVLIPRSKVRILHGPSQNCLQTSEYRRRGQRGKRHWGNRRGNTRPRNCPSQRAATGRPGSPADRGNRSLNSRHELRVSACLHRGRQPESGRMQTTWAGRHSPNSTSRSAGSATNGEWAQFHTLKDLAAAIAIEAAELQELLL